MKLDIEFREISLMVNELYLLLDREDEKEDFPFSVLKIGIVTWRYRVFKKNKKTLFSCSKEAVQMFLKSIKY